MIRIGYGDMYYLKVDYSCGAKPKILKRYETFKEVEKDFEFDYRTLNLIKKNKTVPIDSNCKIWIERIDK